MPDEVFRTEGGRQIAGPSLPAQQTSRRGAVAFVTAGIVFLAGVSLGVMGASVFLPDLSDELDQVELRAAEYRSELDTANTTVALQNTQIELLKRRVADVRADPDHPFVYVRGRFHRGCAASIVSAIVPRAKEADLLSAMRDYMTSLATGGQTSIRADRGEAGKNVWGIIYSESCLP